MKSLRLLGNKEIRIGETNMPDPRTYDNRLITPAHKTAGLFVSVGPDVSILKVGDRVAVYRVIGCGCCESYQNGNITSCKKRIFDRFHQDSGFADYLISEEANCIMLPDRMSFCWA
jgi:D-arabinose 1-dehydrogenase-like Zn-dependent alcohol dehydrogenase